MSLLRHCDQCEIKVPAYYTSWFHVTREDRPGTERDFCSPVCVRDFYAKLVADIERDEGADKLVSAVLA